MPASEAASAGCACGRTAPLAEATIGYYLDSARLLGQRTGELHVALAQATEDPLLRQKPLRISTDVVCIKA